MRRTCTNCRGGEWPRYRWCGACWRAFWLGAIAVAILLGSLSMAIDMIRFGV